MATRFRLTSDTTAPDVSPAIQSYTHDQGSRRKLLTSDSSALTTSTYSPDAADDHVAGDAHHIQFVSDTMEAGITFTNGDTIKTSLQCAELNANNNLFLQIFVSVVSSDGGTVRRTLRSKSADGAEMTSITNAVHNRFHTTTQDGADYTTVSGDRLVVEYSFTGTPAAGAGTNAHNARARWGSDGSSGDLDETDGDDALTWNPWIEFVPTITFAAAEAGANSVVIIHGGL